jgi:hypothetical protein
MREKTNETDMRADKGKRRQMKQMRELTDEKGESILREGRQMREERTTADKAV